MLKFENKNNGRYYYIYVETDLFGDNVLCVIRGGTYVSGILSRMLSGTEETIQAEIERLSRLRLQRGYILISN